MSLYLTIFDGAEEMAGWVLGHYSDFGYFRDKVAEVLDARRYPRLMTHSDSDGEWSVDAIADLQRELQSIGDRFKELPPEYIDGAFEHTVEYRSGAQSLSDCFHNVDGENLFEALLDLCGEALRLQRPILFQ
jgi:hypothetical protein